MPTPKLSAGLLPFRTAAGGGLEVLVAHMGGPFWARKDEHAWSIVKGEYELGENPFAAAQREFAEETGQPAPGGEYVGLGDVKQSGGKRVTAWAVEAPGLDPATFVSNTFTIEWPPRSGKQQAFPEIDRAAWFPVDVAATKLVKGQVPLLGALQEALAANQHDTK